MIILLVLFGVAAGQRGHYIVDYQRLPLYQEFYLSPGLYRPLFPAKTEVGHHHEARRIDAPTARHHKLHTPHAQLQSNALVSALPATQAQTQNVDRPVQLNASRPEPSRPSPEDNTLPYLPEPAVVVAQPAQQQQPQDTQAVVVTAQQQQQQHQQQQQQQSPAAAQDVSAPVLQYSNSMTQDGSYSYKYETADGLMREESSVMGPTGEDGRMVATVRGSYSYPGPDGRTIRVDYIADEGGFRASGDHLPQGLQDTVYNFKYVIP